MDESIRNFVKKYKWPIIIISITLIIGIILLSVFLSKTAEGTSFTNFELAVLKNHNEYRQKHGVNPLKLNKEICKVAQNWANIIAAKGEIKHSTDGKYGENIFWSRGMSLNGATCVKSWYDEIKLYDFTNGGFSISTGHFTQLVWRDSRELGVGYAQKDDEIYIVANYDPPGNYNGKYLENVPPPLR